MLQYNQREGETLQKKGELKMKNINIDNIIREMLNDLNAICGEAANAEEAAWEEG